MSQLDSITSVFPLWGDDSARLLAGVKAVVPFDRLAAGIVQIDHPHPDELLLVAGWEPRDLLPWYGFSQRSPRSKVWHFRGSAPLG